MNMDLDAVEAIKKRLLQEIIKDLKDLEFPFEWRSRDVLGFIIRKLEDKESSC